MFLGDSRTMEGPGIIPAQDHRERIDVDARALRIAVRIIDRRPGNEGASHVHDEEIQADIQGLSFWPNVEGKRPMSVARHTFPCVVLNRGPGIDGPVTPSGGVWGPTTPGGGGYDANLGATTLGGGEIPENSRNIISWQHPSLADIIAAWSNGGY